MVGSATLDGDLSEKLKTDHFDQQPKPPDPYPAASRRQNAGVWLAAVSDLTVTMNNVTTVRVTADYDVRSALAAMGPFRRLGGRRRNRCETGECNHSGQYDLPHGISPRGRFEAAARHPTLLAFSLHPKRDVDGNLLMGLN